MALFPWFTVLNESYNNLKYHLISLLFNIFILLNIIQIITSHESSQNIRCSSIPFCQRLMYISESKIPLYFVDNKTIEIIGTNNDRNNIFIALNLNYNQEYINYPIDSELITVLDVF